MWRGTPLSLLQDTEITSEPGREGMRLSARMHVTPRTSLIIIINYRIHTTQSPSLRACEYADDNECYTDQRMGVIADQRMGVMQTSAWVLCRPVHGCYADQCMGVMRISAWVFCGPAHGCFELGI